MSDPRFRTQEVGEDSAVGISAAPGDFSVQLGAAVRLRPSCRSAVSGQLPRGEGGKDATAECSQAAGDRSGADGRERSRALPRLSAGM